jgi:hypothetical protein
MPIGRYMAWVGAALLTLLFVTNWLLPQSLAEPAAQEINKPVIRIATIQQPPERIVIDTNLPTIVPPPTLPADAVSWARLSEQIFRIDKWSLCRG